MRHYLDQAREEWKSGGRQLRPGPACCVAQAPVFAPPRDLQFGFIKDWLFSVSETPKFHRELERHVQGPHGLFGNAAPSCLLS